MAASTLLSNPTHIELASTHLTKSANRNPVESNMRIAANKNATEGGVESGSRTRDHSETDRFAWVLTQRSVPQHV
jgi:hypothetical protein